MSPSDSAATPVLLFVKPAKKAVSTSKGNCGTLLAGTSTPKSVEEALNRIVIKCPNTGKMIYTGYSMDPKTFGAIPIEQMDPIECPACHKMHRWGKGDALFERETQDPKKSSA